MLRLTKYHGLGNDFLVALRADNPGMAPDPAVARALCDRHLGVGADGLIHGLAPGGDAADVHMVLLNADGSEAEISGNGIRCLGQAVLRHTGRSEGDVTVETVGGARELRTVRGDVDGELWMRVDMGRPGPGPSWARPPPPTRRGDGRRSTSATRTWCSWSTIPPRSTWRRRPAAGGGLPGRHQRARRGALPARTPSTCGCGSGASASPGPAGPARWRPRWPPMTGAWSGTGSRSACPAAPPRWSVDDRGAHLTGPSTFVAEVIVP